jgi:hypothetical protein
MSKAERSINSALKFHRTHTSVYHAKGATKSYAVYRDKIDHWWILDIRELTETAGVRHSINQPVIATQASDVKRLAIAVANTYEKLSDDYCSHEHGYRERITEAIQIAYASDKIS